MLPKADQTAGPKWLQFFVDTHGLWGCVIGLKFEFFFQFFSTGNAGRFS